MPSGSGSSALRDKRTLPSGCTSMTFTSITSPTLRTSETFSTRRWSICEMWRRPSFFGRSSMNAPRPSRISLTLPLKIVSISIGRVMSRILAIAASALSWFTAAIVIVPSSSMLISAPVSLTIERIISPPGPITAPIISTGMVIVVSFGAYGDRSAFGADMCWFMMPRMCKRPSRACASAVRMMSTDRPSILMSI